MRCGHSSLLRMKSYNAISALGAYFMHVLRLAVNAGKENVFFIWRLRTGSLHEWAKQHLVRLLGSVWYRRVPAAGSAG